MDYTFLYKKGWTEHHKNKFKAKIIDKINESLGVPIYFNDIDLKNYAGRYVNKRYDGETLYKNDKAFCIGLKWQTDRIENNNINRLFILFHELGHYYLHPTFNTGKSHEEEETEADTFADIIMGTLCGCDYDQYLTLSRYTEKKVNYEKINNIACSILRKIKDVL